MMFYSGEIQLKFLLNNLEMSLNTSKPYSFRLNVVLLLLIAVNIVNTIYPKFDLGTR